MLPTGFLEKKNIFLDYPFASFAELTDFICDRFSAASLHDLRSIRAALPARPDLRMVYLGNRTILPHAYSDSLDRIIVLFIRFTKDTSLAVENRIRAVRYVFAALIPNHLSSQYLKVLKTMAYIVMNHAKSLEVVTTPGDLLHLINEEAVEVDDSITAGDYICCTSSVKSTELVTEAIRRMDKSGYTIIPVVDDDGVLKGIIDMADLLNDAYPEGAITSESLKLLLEIHSMTQPSFCRYHACLAGKTESSNRLNHEMRECLCVCSGHPA